MTTIIGIHTNAGREGIVFGSDTQLNYEDDDGRLSEKRVVYKIIDGRDWMMGHAGGIDNNLYKFQNRLTQPKKYKSSEEEAQEIILGAIQNYERGPRFREPHFLQVNYLSTISRREGMTLEDLHEFILAAKYDSKIGMWHVDEFGSLKQPQKDNEFEYITIGSGSDRVEKYFDEMVVDEKVDASTIDIPEALELIVRALHKAERDAFTGGAIDLTVLTAEGVDPYGRSIRKAVSDAERNLVGEIKQKYNGS
jgi:hypothetical protein